MQKKQKYHYFLVKNCVLSRVMISVTPHYIMKTCLYNFEPLKPHFYRVKLGLLGDTLIFLFLLKSTDCGYSLEPPRRGGSKLVRTDSQRRF